MIKAELHGKLADDAHNATERGEDVLTSNVLGTFSYLPPALVLLPFLRKAEGLRPPLPLVADDVTDAQVLFWPKIGTRQADAVVCLSAPLERVDIVVVECKYLSGKSQAVVGDEDGPDERGEGVPSGDQLADYLAGARQGDIGHAGYISPRVVGRVALVYVTADASMPKTDLRESEEEYLRTVGSGEDDCALYWLSWSAAWVAISAALLSEVDEFRVRILTDLKALLERKHLRPFLGFSRLADAVPYFVGSGRWRYRWDLQTVTTPAPHWYSRQSLWRRLQPPARIPNRSWWRRPWCIVAPMLPSDIGGSIFYERVAPRQTSGSRYREVLPNRRSRS